LDSLRERGLTLMLFFLQDSFKKREVAVLRLMLQLLEVLRCMDEIPMIASC
jgi:hypothetical protein